MKTSIPIFTILLLCTACKETKKNTAQPITTIETTHGLESQIENRPQIPSFNIKAQEKITSPKQIRVNSEGYWKASEGKLGWVELIDDRDNKLARGILKAEGEWMNDQPALFATTLTFDAKNSEKGTLIIHNNVIESDDDQAGEHIKIEIPITF